MTKVMTGACGLAGKGCFSMQLLMLVKFADYCNHLRIYHECEGRIEKFVPRDHRLSSFGKPRDAKR